MIWYYVNANGEQAGPISEAELKAAAASGTIEPDTLVWKDGLAQWTKYRDLPAGSIAIAVPAATAFPGMAGATASCSECGANYPTGDMANFGGSWVCARCKPLYVQKLREGVPVSGATFWRSKKTLVMPGGATLPRRCIKCNDDVAEDPIKRKLNWHSPAIYVAVLISPIIYLIIALCCRKRSTALISVCRKHRSSRRNAILVSWLLVLGGIGAFIAGVASQNQSLVGPLVSAGGIMFLIGIIYGIVRGRLVYATRIADDQVWLGGCKEKFLAGFPDLPGK